MRSHGVSGMFAVVAVMLLMTGCVGAPTARSAGGGISSGVIKVVAAEDFWGSIAAQLGGSKVSVTSIITNPNTDPHEYEPTVQDAKGIATARLVLYNGVGYDPWVQRLLAASPVTSRAVLDVGSLVGVSPGGNPHRWYSPADVRMVIAKISADYTRIDPADAAYFDNRRKRFETVSLAEYDRLIGEISARYRGTPVGASESIAAPLAQALGLDLITPPTFLNAISEGVDPAAADKATVDDQIRSRSIKVFIYNDQNATPDVAAIVHEARVAGIPVVAVSETMVPASSTFQDWQVGQLRALEQALKRATGR
jgi:zinc/manganese transport system substrate-binding protein